MAILVTGGAGFIGSHLVELLLRETGQRVVVLDNFGGDDPALKRQNLANALENDQLVLMEGNFCDQNLVERVLLDQGVRAICHLGGLPGVPASLRDPLAFVQNNVTGTTALLDAVRKHPVERFLYASSSTVYGRGAAAPFIEDAPLGIPCSPYGASKRAAELMGLCYHDLFGVPFVSLRLFNVIGPRLRPELALAAFTKAILNGEPVPLHGDGSVLRDFTHVSDVCRGFLAALAAPNVAGQCLNLGNDRPITIRRLIELIEQAAGRRAQIAHHPPRSEDMPLTHADLAKSRRLLGYQPLVSIDNTVAEYVAWFRQQSST